LNFVSASSPQKSTINKINNQPPLKMSTEIKPLNGNLFKRSGPFKSWKKRQFFTSDAPMPLSALKVICPIPIKI
jgi:hypothetical protein